MAPLSINVGDMIEVPTHTVGTDLYSVRGIYLGATGNDSLVELTPMTQGRGSDGPKPTNGMVPLRMIEAGVSVGAFTHTPLP